MPSRHPKAVRRQILLFLYDYFHKDPHGMATPEEFMETDEFQRDELPPNAFYLHERKLIEIMHGYTPPMFAAARITAGGIDLVENEREFNMRFPDGDQLHTEDTGDILYLVEKLIEEADFSALDGENRQALLRDVQYLRDEVARPAPRWRKPVIEAILYWIDDVFEDPDERLPALEKIRQRIKELQDQTT